MLYWHLMDTFDSDYIIFVRDGEEFIVTEFKIPKKLKIFQSKHSERIVARYWLNFYRTNPHIKLPDFFESRIGYISRVRCPDEDLLIVYETKRSKEMIRGTIRKCIVLEAILIIKI